MLNACAAACAALAAVSGAPISVDAADRANVLRIFDDFDDFDLTADEQLENYVEDAVILAPDAAEVRGKAALYVHIAAFLENDGLEIDHQIVDLTSLAEVVVVQGRVVGQFTSPEDGEVYPFETKNLILFRRQGEGDLKVWKVIYNAAPLSD